MKTRIYFAILILIIPVQASLFEPLSIAGIKPDLALALIYIIGLLTGPLEGAIAGMLVGLTQDIGSASILGVSGFSRGLVGLSAGILGKRVLDIASPTNAVFILVFSLLEGAVVMLFMQTYYGNIPFLSIFLGQIVPQALYTGLLGMLLLRLLSRKDFITAIVRRSLVKE